MLIRGDVPRPSAPPASPNCHQQTIDVGRRAAAARCPTERRTGASRSSRTPQVDLACPSLSTASRSAKRAMPFKPPQRSCLNRGAVAHHRLARAAAFARKRNIAKKESAKKKLRRRRRAPRARARGIGAIKVNALPQRSCLNRGAVAHHRLARAAAFARKRNIAKKESAKKKLRRRRRAPRARARGIGAKR